MAKGIISLADNALATKIAELVGKEFREALAEDRQLRNGVSLDQFKNDPIIARRQND